MLLSQICVTSGGRREMFSVCMTRFYMGTWLWNSVEHIRNKGTGSYVIKRPIRMCEESAPDSMEFWCALPLFMKFKSGQANVWVPAAQAITLWQWKSWWVWCRHRAGVVSGNKVLAQLKSMAGNGPLRVRKSLWWGSWPAGSWSPWIVYWNTSLYFLIRAERLYSTSLW